MTIEDVAKKAYHAYGEVTEFKNYQGLPMPKWEDLPKKIKLAWIAATKTAANEVIQVIGKWMVN